MSKKLSTILRALLGATLAMLVVAAPAAQASCPFKAGGMPHFPPGMFGGPFMNGLAGYGGLGGPWGMINSFAPYLPNSFPGGCPNGDCQPGYGNDGYNPVCADGNCQTGCPTGDCNSNGPFGQCQPNCLSGSGNGNTAVPSNQSQPNCSNTIGTIDTVKAAATQLGFDANKDQYTLTSQTPTEAVVQVIHADKTYNLTLKPTANGCWEITGKTEAAPAMTAMTLPGLVDETTVNLANEVMIDLSAGTT